MCWYLRKAGDTTTNRPGVDAALFVRVADVRGRPGAHTYTLMKSIPASTSRAVSCRAEASSSMIAGHRQGAGVSARPVQDGSGAEEARPAVPALLEGPEHLVGVGVAGVPDRRHPVAQQRGHELVGRRGGVVHLEERVVGRQPHVDMAVGKARYHRGAADLHHFGVGGEFHVASAPRKIVSRYRVNGG